MGSYNGPLSRRSTGLELSKRVRSVRSATVSAGRNNMLQTPIRSNHSISRDTVPPDGLPVVSLADVADFIRRRLWIISLTCLVTWGIALLYLIAAVPTFTAEADLVIESNAPSRDAASVSTIVESQIGI